MSLYELLKFLHVLAAAVWVGGAVMLRVQSSRAAGMDDERAAVVAAGASEAATKLLMPASILLLVTGLWAAFEGGYGLEPAWIKIGLLIYVASAVAGAAFLGPLSKRVGTLQGQRPAGDAEVGSLLRRLSALSWVDLGLLVLAVFVMVVKPD